MNTTDVKDLEGWVPLADAADMMKMSANGVRKRVFEYDEFPPDDVRKVTIGNNVVYLLRLSKVQEAVAVELRERETFQTDRQPVILRRKAKQQQRKEILAWAKTSGFEKQHAPVPTMGRLSNALVAAWTEATGKQLIE